MASKRKAAHAEKLEKLRELAIDPSAQAVYATTLLDARNGTEVVITALQLLTRTPHAPARDALWNLYDHYGKRGERQDPAAYIRSTIVRALREVVLPDDVSRLARVTSTYVFPPPQFKEEGAMLRSAALAALNELDDELARYHAVRLLADEHTDPMSGEPALTAAKVLASREEVLPLYFYVMQSVTRVLPEVVSACLGNLTSLRTDLLPDLLARFTGENVERRAAHPQGQEISEVVLVGLFDLLINHEQGPQAIDYLATFLQTSDQLDAFRYLVVTMATSGDPLLTKLLIEQAKATTGRDKAALLLDALHLLRSDDPTVNDLIAELETIAHV